MKERRRGRAFVRYALVALLVAATIVTVTAVTQRAASAGISADTKIALIEHELMHTLGPGHTSWCAPSLVDTCTGDVQTYPTAYDKARIYDWNTLKERRYCFTTTNCDAYWVKGTICVENHASTTWPVYTATTRMDALPSVGFVYTRSSCSDAGYAQVVRVYSGDYTASEGKTWYSAAAVWHTTYDEDGDGNPLGDIERAQIRLNNHYL